MLSNETTDAVRTNLSPVRVSTKLIVFQYFELLVTDFVHSILPWLIVCARQHKHNHSLTQ